MVPSDIFRRHCFFIPPLVFRGTVLSLFDKRLDPAIYTRDEVVLLRSCSAVGHPNRLRISIYPDAAVRAWCPASVVRLRLNHFITGIYSNELDRRNISLPGICFDGVLSVCTFRRNLDAGFSACINQIQKR